MMQKLEEIFEVPLFVCTKNSISLNETGKIAAEDALMLLKQTENMLRHARNFDRTNRTIMLGSCTPVHVPDITRRLTTLYPKAAISSETRGISQLLDGIKDGIYHLILLPFCPDVNNLYSMNGVKNTYPFCSPNGIGLPAENL